MSKVSDYYKRIIDADEPLTKVEMEPIGKCDRCNNPLYENMVIRYTTLSPDYEIAHCSDCLEGEYWDFG